MSQDMLRIESGQKEGFAKLEQILTRNEAHSRATADGPATRAPPQDLADVNFDDALPPRRESLFGMADNNDDP
eukprot:896322-Karenia_brevis.AAC.1